MYILDNGQERLKQHAQYVLQYTYIFRIGRYTDRGWTIWGSSWQPLEELLCEERHEGTDQTEANVQTCVARAGKLGQGATVIIHCTCM